MCIYESVTCDHMFLWACVWCPRYLRHEEVKHCHQANQLNVLINRIDQGIPGQWWDTVLKNDTDDVPPGERKALVSTSVYSG